MRWTRSIRWIQAVMLTSTLAGCTTAREVHYLGDRDLSYYRDKVAEIQYPNINPESLPETVTSLKPRTIKDRVTDEVWDLHLSQAIQLAVANNKIIRTQAGAGALLANGNAANSIYDPAINESGVLFGNRGVEAALADFDATFSTSLLFGRNENARNSLLPTPGEVNENETGNFSTTISKPLATGGSVSVRHGMDYLNTNSPGTLFPSSYTGSLSTEFRQPLWAGAGVEYTRIAGPSRAGFGAITGVNQGVVIARINNDITVADFELSVIDMVRDVENVYWDLYLAYRQYDAELTNRDSVLRTWRDTRVRLEQGAAGGRLGDEAQARDSYFEVRSRVETALSNLYETENRLRKLMGMSVNDGKVIRPADTPLEGEYMVAWDTALAEALTRRAELRRQKWQIKSLELQRLAAENVANPRLDFVSSYQVNAFGDNLFSDTNADGLSAQGFNSAYGSLSRGDETGWALGVELSVPIGLRQARSQVRNVELQLMKSRAALAAQELDISHDLAESIQRIDAAYIITRTNLDRRVAAEARVYAEGALRKEGEGTVDLELRAQGSRAAAEIAFYSSLVDYAKALTELNQRQGTLLQVNNIEVAEGEWVPQAYQDALRRAWARSFGWDNNRLHTEPSEFASPVAYPKGVYPQGAPVGAMSEPTPYDESNEQLPPAAPAAEEPSPTE